MHITFYKPSKSSHNPQSPPSDASITSSLVGFLENIFVNLPDEISSLETSKKADDDTDDFGSNLPRNGDIRVDDDKLVVAFMEEAITKAIVIMYVCAICGFIAI